MERTQQGDKPVLPKASTPLSVELSVSGKLYEAVMKGVGRAIPPAHEEGE